MFFLNISLHVFWFDSKFCIVLLSNPKPWLSPNFTMSVDIKSKFETSSFMAFNFSITTLFARSKASPNECGKASVSMPNISTNILPNSGFASSSTASSYSSLILPSSLFSPSMILLRSYFSASILSSLIFTSSSLTSSGLALPLARSLSN